MSCLLIRASIFQHWESPQPWSEEQPNSKSRPKSIAQQCDKYLDLRKSFYHMWTGSFINWNFYFQKKQCMAICRQGNLIQGKARQALNNWKNRFGGQREDSLTNLEVFFSYSSISAMRGCQPSSSSCYSAPW